MADQQLKRAAAYSDDGVPPPPPLLLWAAIALFMLFIVGAAAAWLWLQNRPTPSQLLGIAIVAAPLLTVGSLLVTFLLRRRLLRRLWLMLAVLWLAIWLIGGTAFVVVFRSVLAPGQRETVKTYLPFMELFAPPAPPPDTALPTPVPNQAGGISAEDLLAGPLGAPAAPVVVTATPTPTPQPTATVVAAVPTPTPEPIVPTLAPQTTSEPALAFPASSGTRLPVSARLDGITPVKQGWNNCGPANVTMALSYYGWTRSQDFAANYLKPDREDKNVSPWELVNFVREQSDIEALTRIGGDMALLKTLLSNRLPVIIETGYLYEGSDWLGHYKTVIGYDDVQGVFFIYDSWLGTGENANGIPISYAQFDTLWQNFNRTFIVLYQPQEEGLVMSLLGDRADETSAAEAAAEAAQAEARTNPRNAFAWFNLGSSLARLGQYDRAEPAFDRALQLQELLPWRMLWYQFEMYDTYYQRGRYNDVLALSEANLTNGGEYIEETHYWHGRALAALGRGGEAAEAFRRALRQQPRFEAASAALNSLTQGG